MVETEFTLVRTGGDQGASDALYGGAHPMTAADIASTIFWVASQPAHLNFNSIELMPVSQSFAGFQVPRAICRPPASQRHPKWRTTSIPPHKPPQLPRYS